MRLKISKKFLIMLSLLFLLTVSRVSAQCGPDGTQACPKKNTSTKTKPKTTDSSGKTKPTPTKTLKPTKVINKNPLFNKLLGTWDMGHGDTTVFLSNGTGTGTDSNEPCVNFKYTLKGDILEVNGKPVGNCVEKDQPSSRIARFRIRFDEKQLLWMVMLKPDGSDDGPERSAKKIN
jgi:hypothetical protein